jgi:pyruvate dehydrogenase E1 component beta subunit
MLYREALNKAIDEMMSEDESVVILGEDVGRYGGSYRVSEGLYAKYGGERVIDTPIAELSIVGNSVGMALAGLRPIAEIMTANFSLLAFDQIINHASKFRYMSAGKLAIPLVVRMATGVSRQLAAQHSENYDSMFINVPGLRVISPSNSTSAYYSLKYAIKSNDPIVFLEHELLYPKDEEFKEVENFDPFKAEIVKEGKDLTIITYSKMRYDCLEALNDIDLDVELIDLNSISPIDIETIKKSISKTKKAVIVEENHKTGGVGGEIATQIMENCFYDLDAPVLRISGEDVPIPYNRKLELLSIPTPDKIVAKINVWRSQNGI